MNDAPRSFSPPLVTVLGPMEPGYSAVLSPAALAFVADLVGVFRGRVAALLECRRERQTRFDASELPDFLAETAGVRARGWTVAPLPPQLLDRRVEITGPTDRKMVINGLNSGANAFTADFSDANRPTSHNVGPREKNP